MIATPIQAREKCCPQSMGVWLNQGPEDSGYATADTCVAARCMAWRWLDDNERPNPERRGYCGLAGRPENF